MANVSIALGVPGAGKGHVLAALLQIPGKNYKVVNWGDLMFEIASKRYSDKVKVRDDLRFNLSSGEQLTIQKEVGTAIANMEGNIIVDTHCSIELAGKGGYLPGLPDHVLERLAGKVDKLLYVTATPEELFERRSLDKTRARPGSVESIAAHDQINKYFLAAYSTLLGVPFYIINNEKGKLEQAQAQLVSIMK